MPTILVAGGAGYIGSHVVKQLLIAGHQVVIFDNLSTGHVDAVPKKQLIVGDLANMSELHDCFKKYKIDIVMHFASSIAVGESVINPAKYYRNNVINTLNLLDVMNIYHVNNIIFSSTAAVYGYPKTTPISIDHPRNPENPYGKSKAMIEEIIEDYHRAYGLQYVFLRYFNAAGADPTGDIGEQHTPETHLIPLALQVAKGLCEKLNVYGTDYATQDGTCIRDYVHVCDIAHAHLLAMHQLINTKMSHCFNLGTNVGHSVKEVIASVENITEKKLTVHYCGRRPGDAPILVADATEAKILLGWQPVYTKLEDIIQHAWNFLCMQQLKCF